MSPIIRKQLARRAPGLRLYIIGDGEAPAKGTRDPDILIWLEAQDCLLVTYNYSTMPVHLRDHLAVGRHIPGILEVSEEMSIGMIIEELWLIWGASLPDEFRDQIRYLPLSR